VTPEDGGDDRLLRRLSAELARLHTLEEVAAYILGAVVQVLGGNTGSLCLATDDSNLQIVAEEGYSAAVTAVWSTFPIDAPLPASEAVRTGSPVFLTSPEDRDTRYPIFKERPVVQDDAYAIEPLVVDGRALGALVVGFAQARQFSDDQKALLANVAAACATALARARR
jgi:GAF domain-containing protein